MIEKEHDQASALFSKKNMIKLESEKNQGEGEEQTCFETAWNDFQTLFQLTTLL